MNLFLLYLWLKLDAVRCLITLSGLGLIAFGIVWYLIWRCNYGNDKPKPVLKVGRHWNDDSEYDLRKWLNKENACRRFAQRNRYKWLLGWWLGGFLLISAKMAPSQEDAAYLVAGYAGMQIAQSPEMGKVTELLRAKVNSYLDKQLQEVKAKAVEAAASAVSK